MKNNNSIFLEHHDFFTNTASKISKIMLPLTKMDIKFYSYGKLYDNGDLFYVCNFLEWFDHKVERGLFDFHEHATALFKQQDNKKSHIMQLINGNPNPNCPIQQHMLDFGIWNCIIIYRKYKNFIEVYSYAAPPNKTCINDFYLNNMDFIQNFSFSIKNQMENEFSDFEKRKLFFKIFKKNPPLCESVNFSEFVSNFNRDLKTKYKIYLLNDEVLSISHRELQCLTLLNRGFATKNIAKRLEISHRTVEKYIENLKLKTGCSYKNSLLDIYHYNFCTNIAI